MKKLEIILGIVISISLIMTLAMLPYGNLVFIISFLVLSIIYYPFGFLFFNNIRLRNIFKKESYKGISALRIIGAVGIGMSLSAICIGILFTIQHYPAARVNLLTGFATSLIVAVIALIKYFKNKDIYYARILKRICIIGGFGLFLILLPSLTLDRIQYRNYPEYIKAYEEYLENPENEELRNKMELEFNRATMSEEDFKEYLKFEEEINK